MAIFQILSSLLNVILPPRCLLTGEEVEATGMLAPSVWATLNFISHPLCSCCGLPFDIDTGEDDKGNESALCGACLATLPVFTRARAALRYDDASRNVILAFKHADRTEAVRAFTPWLRRAGSACLNEADVLVPVPLHRWRLLYRRYNQAALLAGSLSRLSGVPWIPDALIRTKATPTQGHMSPSARAENVRGVFALHPRHRIGIQGKRVVLIDDVYTTGATVNACARTLLDAGAMQVNVLTLARVVRGS